MRSSLSRTRAARPSRPPMHRASEHGSRNACLAYAWNSGQRLTYWREELYEVDSILDGSWGR
jgi:hypothetical protein